MCLRVEAELSRVKSKVSRMWKLKKVDLFLIILKNSILTNVDRLHIARCLLGKKINLFLCGDLKSFFFFFCSLLLSISDSHLDLEVAALVIFKEPLEFKNDLPFLLRHATCHSIPFAPRKRPASPETVFPLEKLEVEPLVPLKTYNIQALWQRSRDLCII